MCHDDVKYCDFRLLSSSSSSITARVVSREHVFLNCNGNSFETGLNCRSYLPRLFFLFRLFCFRFSSMLLLFYSLYSSSVSVAKTTADVNRCTSATHFRAQNWKFINRKLEIRNNKWYRVTEKANEWENENKTTVNEKTNWKEQGFTWNTSACWNVDSET